MQNPDLILYSGTFDPPHLGHLFCVEQCLSFFPEAEVRILPTPRPAGAGGMHKSPLAPFDQRVAMCEMLYSEIIEKFPERVFIDTTENELPQPNFSNRTLEVFATKRPDARMALLMGMDQFQSFARWHKPEEILNKASLICANRDQDDAEAAFASSAQKIAEVCELTPAKMNDDVVKFSETGHGAYFLGSQAVPGSSTMVRNESDNENENIVPSTIREYIRSHGLYQ